MLGLALALVPGGVCVGFPLLSTILAILSVLALASGPVSVLVGVSTWVGITVGVSVSAWVGVMVGVSVSARVGVMVGVSFSAWVGVTVGISVSVRVGVTVGISVSAWVGAINNVIATICHCAFLHQSLLIQWLCHCVAAILFNVPW